MNILLLNTTYLCGGAEKVTNQIFEGMRKRGHQVYEIVSYYKRSEPLPDGVSVLYQGAPMLIFNRLLTGNHSNANLTIPYSLHQIISFIRKHHIDVVHLHNAHGNFLGIQDIQKISEICPVVWTLHDFWALTGHCTSPTGCDDLWKTGCPSCPQLGNYPPLRTDISSHLFERKKAALHTPDIYYTVPSQWMKEKFMQSHLSQQDCTCIPNSLDTNLWVPYSKQELRGKYHLPDDKRILAFVAADPQKESKGMSILLDALQLLPHPEEYLLLIAGREGGLDQLSQKGFSVRHFGYLADQHKMNEFYSLADILVNPSIYETFGLVNIEAMASGTPVIAFDVCAMSEIISSDGGWCVPQISSQLLADAVSTAFSIPAERKEKSLTARSYCVAAFSECQMLDSYEALYKRTAAC